MAFQLPRSDNDSPNYILGLPAELRLKILRYLLKRKEPIYSRMEFDERCRRREEPYCTEKLMPQRYRSQGALSSQLLSTCQQLCLEGRDVLYRENTLCVYYGSGPRNYRSRTECCCILESSATVPLDLTRLKDVMSGLLDCTDTPKGDGRTTWLRDAQPLAQAYPAIGAFQKIHLTLDPFMANGAWVASRILRELLSGKDVTIVATDRVPQNTLVALKILRCRSVNVILQKPASEGVERMDIERVITSAEPVEDTLRAWRMLKTNVLDKLPHRQGVLEWSKLLSELSHAAFHYDGERYEKLEDKVLHQASLWNEEDAQQQITMIHKAMEERREAIKKHRSSTTIITYMTSDAVAG